VILNTSTPQTLVTATTNADGTWEATFTAPAVTFKNYKVNASDEYNVWDDAGFKVGLIAMIVNPTSGPSGDVISLTGIGFANGDYNMSFGDDDTYLQGTVAGEAISDTFFVPTIAVGTYVITVTDSNENVLSTTFTVTATTSMMPTPEEVAIGYNMSIFGEDFSNAAGTDLTFYIYNSTWSDEITVIDMGAPVEVAASGNFTGYWVLTNDTLLGNIYTINATDDNDLWAEFNFTVVPEAIEIWPNSPSYSLGEIITFTIRATFAKHDAVLAIYDPSGELVFRSMLTGPPDNIWELSESWQTIRYWNQLNEVGNPLLIPNDSEIGTWVWNITDADDELVAEGTIDVLPTTAEQVDARLSEVEGSLNDLADDIAGVQTDLADDLDALSGEIGDVASEVDNLRDEIVSELADDIAAATAAANAAGDAISDLEGSMSDLEDSVGDIADTANSAKSAADAAADAASDAASAAEDASSAASGLTTLVYGAIGASLIAALAAIVSLMQISRRIAG
jgi:uncharacterized protein YoxC